MITLKFRDEFNRIIAKDGFSKRAFARKCGLSESTIIQISNGRQSPRPDTAKKICDGLQLNFDDIFSIKEKTCNQKGGE
ncbi:helix-turn-helix transcriptional regulator [Psychrobacillus sp. NPDC058041]|uniref:helix-turn-helix transcriptional regulator n=1 Tax=Psychrobacillus sp. NPDC058041 TaxID=3346310 RepID=UPI0036DD00A9